jgi:hypothetical protein
MSTTTSFDETTERFYDRAHRYVRGGAHALWYGAAIYATARITGDMQAGLLLGTMALPLNFAGQRYFGRMLDAVTPVNAAALSADALDPPDMRIAKTAMAVAGPVILPLAGGHYMARKFGLLKAHSPA